MTKRNTWTQEQEREKKKHIVRASTVETAEQKEQHSTYIDFFLLHFIVFH